MAHNLNFNRAKQSWSFYTRKEKAWHGLGQVVEEAQNSDEVIKTANLDYEVIKVPNFAKLGDEYILNTESYSTVRTDTKQVLGTVGGRYQIIQNREAFQFFDDIVGAKEAIFETAGALGEGEKVFISAKLPDIIRYSNNDIIEDYLLFVNSHTGKEPLKVLFTPVRVVCNNTLRMALHRFSNSYSINHNSLTKDRLKEVINMMGLKNIYLEEMKLNMKRLESVNVDESLRKQIVMELILTQEELQLVVQNKKLLTVDEISTRKKNMIVDINNWVESGIGQNMYEGTGLWLYNGINGYYSNGKQYTGEGKRLENLMDGDAYNNTNKSMNLILQHV